MKFELPKVDMDVIVTVDGKVVEWETDEKGLKYIQGDWGLLSISEHGAPLYFHPEDIGLCLLSPKVNGNDIKLAELLAQM